MEDEVEDEGGKRSPSYCTCHSAVDNFISRQITLEISSIMNRPRVRVTDLCTARHSERDKEEGKKSEILKDDSHEHAPTIMLGAKKSRKKFELLSLITLQC